MSEIGLEQKEVVEEIYLILAEFFKFPTEEFYQEVVQGLIDQRLEELTGFMGYPKPNVFFKNRFTSFQEMKQLYVRCFMGVVQPYAPPVESVYKVWTKDPTASLPNATSKGYYYGDSALHLRHLYQQFQLEIPEEYTSMPDHLTLLLEFLTFLVQNGTIRQVYQLIVDHFDWLDDFRTELTKVENSQFYLDVTDVLIAIISYERQSLANINQIEDSV
ncbi:TorD/DmsD family molecular chaperone [Tepidibacillus fermentans]|uniref:TorA maturation chaperone TorD n=1 Tax=Tepidibacillus fermentans TaxID=1281767 RepID=A0A4R3KLI2_9BACI|nr:molecular chaperone TorD family protein [Tepidibacillus fermentans]TCS84462.1 TorA maturation chaperone TorD [Tepidibacillus fermentans]